MDFRDKLLANTHTIEEAQSEAEKETLRKIETDVKNTVELIKRDLLIKAENAEYVIDNGRRIIHIMCYLPYEYCVRKEIKPTYTLVKKSRFSSLKPVISDIDSYSNALMQLSPGERAKYDLVQQTPGYTAFETNGDDYKSFIDLLRKELSTDGINITPVIIDKKTGKEYFFPCKTDVKLGWMDYTFMGKCECAIPEKYSTDIPIVIETDSLEERNDSAISIDSMDGHVFDSFCANLLCKNGFSDVSVTKGSGDQGIDIIAFKDGIKYDIQCKCYSSDIGNSAIQEAFAGKTFYKCHVGVVITNRYFTRSAKELAESNGILLWDRSYLLELIEKAGSTTNK